jgi:NifU-like protein involved in Fe-S cluster formation
MTYSDATLNYFRAALGADTAAGVLAGPGTWRGAAGDRAQGAWVQFDVQIRSEIIQAARFLAFGCPHTIAVAAWLAEQAVGNRARAALPESVQNLSDRFAVPVEKRGRLLIVEDAWLAAMAGYAASHHTSCH